MPLTIKQENKKTQEGEYNMEELGFTVIEELDADGSNARLYIRKFADGDGDESFDVCISAGDSLDLEINFKTLEEAEKEFEKRIEDFLKDYKDWCY